MHYPMDSIHGIVSNLSMSPCNHPSVLQIVTRLDLGYKLELVWSLLLILEEKG